MEIAESTIRPREMKWYSREVIRLNERYGREITAKELLEEARAKRSPLHKYFDWGDASAAEKWRVHQARLLICQVRVRVVDETGRKVPARALWNVRTEKGRRAYVNIGVVTSSPSMRQQIVEEAIEKLHEWVARYRIYKELSGLRKAIDSLLKSKARKAV